MSTNKDFITMKVWITGAQPGVHPHLLSLETPNALMFFLEALAHGNFVFPAGKTFTIVAYQGLMAIGQGFYQIHFNDVGDYSLRNDPEPVKLIVVRETGEIEGIVQDAWSHMLNVTGLYASEEEK
jgi:hypothetical protein